MVREKIREERLSQKMGGTEGRKGQGSEEIEELRSEKDVRDQREHILSTGGGSGHRE